MFSFHVFAGLESGFVTLPRLSRSERQSQGSSPPSCPPEIHRGSLTDTGSSFPCSDSVSPSDSMNSFTLDLGPSLMSEVFAMIDSPVCEKSNFFSENMLEAGPALGSTDDDVDSDATASLVDSLLREDGDGRTRLYGGEWKHSDFVNGESPKKSKVGDGMFSYAVEIDHGMEPERFQRAADVLARHYGGGLRNTDANGSHRRPYNYPDEEEEIKV